MRAALLSVVLVACGPKVDPNTGPQRQRIDEDLGPQPTAAAPAAPIETAARPEAPPGPGIRNGTIERARLVAVLDGGPGAFLRQLEVTPRMDGDRFVGWQLVQLLDRTGPLVGIDVVPGDVLLAVNGKPLSRPDQLQVVWDSLRTANAINAELWRGNAKLELSFTIDPPVAAK